MAIKTALQGMLMAKDDIIIDLTKDIKRLTTENLNLREKLLIMEAKNNTSNAEILELKEKLVDCQRFIKAVRLQQFTEAFEDWLDDDEDDYNGVEDEHTVNNEVNGDVQCQRIHQNNCMETK